MRVVAVWAVALLAIIGSGVGVVAAVWQPPPSVYSPTGVALRTCVASLACSS
jgi:hypothetical protein